LKFKNKVDLYPVIQINWGIRAVTCSCMYTSAVASSDILQLYL